MQPNARQVARLRPTNRKMIKAKTKTKTRLARASATTNPRAQRKQRQMARLIKRRVMMMMMMMLMTQEVLVHALLKESRTHAPHLCLLLQILMALTQI